MRLSQLVTKLANHSFEMLCKLMYIKMIQELKDLFGLKDFGHLTIQPTLVLIGLAIFTAIQAGMV